MYILPIQFATPYFDEAFAIRRESLLEPLGLIAEPEEMEEEADAIHIACFTNNSELIAALSITDVEEQFAEFRHVTVKNAFQSQHIGEFLITQCESFVKNLGYNKVMVNAHEKVVDFYEKMGFRKVGDAFTASNILHFRMEKNL